MLRSVFSVGCVVFSSVFFKILSGNLFYACWLYKKFFNIIFLSFYRKLFLFQMFFPVKIFQLFCRFFRYLIQEFFCLVKGRDKNLLTESKQVRYVRSFRFVPAFEIFCWLDSEIVTSVIGLWKFCFCLVSWFRKASYGIVTEYFVKTLSTVILH